MGWEHRETAPKDGSEFLAVFKVGGYSPDYSVVRWDGGGSFSFGCYECSPVSNKPDTSAESVELLRSHIDWLRGDHDRCNPWLADTIKGVITELERLQRLLKAERYDYARATDERDKARAEIFTAYDSGYAAGLGAAENAVLEAPYHDDRDWDVAFDAIRALKQEGKK